MGIVAHFSQSVLVLAGLILLGTMLRKQGLFEAQHSRLFAKVVTDITLPALIFSSLAVQSIQFKELEQPIVMIAAEAVCLLAAWGIACGLRLPRPQKGAFILVAAFGSSAFLGYPIIKQAFPGQPDVLTDAVVVSELGVGVLIFTVGVLVAMHFGRQRVNVKESVSVFGRFLRSPVFVAVAAGLLVSFLFPWKQNSVFLTLVYFAKTLGAANTVFVALTIGIMLSFRDLRSIVVLAALACVIKLLLKPFLVAQASDMMALPHMWKTVMVIEAAMPSATLAVVFADRYGCDGQLASKLLMATLLCSVVTMIGVVAAFL